MSDPLSDGDKEEAFKTLLKYQFDRLEKEQKRHKRAADSTEKSIIIIMKAAKENGVKRSALRGVLEKYGYWPLPAKWIFAMRESPVRKQ